MKREFERIEHIRAILTRDCPAIQIGIGDDAAVIARSGNEMAWTIDVAVEGVHFRREFASWKDIGWRSYMAAASDLAAMGAQPAAAQLALIVPKTFEETSFDALLHGIADAADEVRAPIAGGNLSSGSEVSITTTLIGELKGPALTRSGARPQDLIFVTGAVGASALGLHVLMHNKSNANDTRHPHFIETWKRPQARIKEGLQLRNIATAAIDISDGLLQDLTHICKASHVGAILHADQLPLAKDHRALANDLGLDPYRLALTGGEDYELLFTAPSSAVVESIGTCIGSVVKQEEGIRVIGPNKELLQYETLGFSHF